MNKERKPIDYLDPKDYGNILNYIDEIEDRIYPEVRELESDYSEALEAIDLMIIDRDAYHDENVRLEKKLKIAVELLKSVRKQTFDALRKAVENDIDSFLNQLKGESE